MFDNQLLGLQRIALIGREKYLKAIFDAAETSMRKKRPVAIMLEGVGGIGKTAVLEELLHQIKSIPHTVVPSEFVDLYHLENQTAHGLAQSIVQSLKDSAGNVFTSFDEHMRRLYEAMSHNEPKDVEKHWDEAEKEFFRAIKTLCRERQVWIILDTVEVIYPDGGREKADVDNPVQHKSAYTWLTQKFMAEVRGCNLVLVLAGRPPDDGHRRIVVPEHWLAPSRLHLEPLGEQDCVTYLQRLADVVETKDASGAENIRAYLQKFPAQFMHQQSGGMPLHLAMMGDVLRQGGSLPRGYYEKTTEQSNVEALARQFMGLRSPLGLTLSTLAVLRKGCDEKLLALLLDINTETAAKYLALVRDMTLVKHRRHGDTATERYFLHDEIYDLYARHFPLPPVLKERYFAQINSYYARERKEIERLEQLYPLFRGQYRKRLYVYYAEAMHYAWQFKPWQGFVSYFVYSESSINQRNEEWDLLLTTELERTITQLRAHKNLPDELEPYLKHDKALREVERLSAHAKGKDAQALLERYPINDEMPAFCQAYYHLLRATLVARGQERTLRSQEALELLKTAGECLDKEIRKDDFGDAIAVLRGFIENYRGLFYRRRGQYLNAVKSYQTATALLRRHGFTGLSGTLVNQAYAMSLLGYDFRAREIGREAYDLAVRYGSVHDQIRALNIRCQVASFAGEAREAMEFGERALELLEKYPDQRLQGLLYVSLARACRYLWNQAVSDSRQDSGYEYLKKGLGYIEEHEKYIDIFPGQSLATNKAKKNTRQIGEKGVAEGALQLLKGIDPENFALACNEAGALWRELCWRHHKINEAQGSKKHTESAEHNKLIADKAEKLADERFRYAAGVNQSGREDWEKVVREHARELDVSMYVFTLPLVNLAWHYHYLRKEKSLIEDLLSLIERLVPDDYLWHGDRPPEVNIEEADVMLWAIMGKLEMLRGYELLRDWREKKKQQPDIVAQAVMHIALALEYDYQHGQASFNGRRALMALENRIRQSTDWEVQLLPEVYRAVIELKLREDGKTLRLRKWLEERFGLAELWV